MKNLHLLPTDKPSNLRYFCGKLERMYIVPKKSDITFQNIYITSDEEIKEWDYGILGKEVLSYNQMHKKWGMPQGEKIILTTDPDLIKDGVQAIDDEFLEWFVKNPSCEEVKIEKVLVTNSGLGHQEYAVLDSSFKVIEINAKIPQTSYSLGKVTILDSYEYVVDYKIIIPKEEPKDETLEEAAGTYYPSGDVWTEEEAVIRRIAFTNGAKWQAERMYSEADKIMKFLDTEVELKLSDVKTIERIKWYFETYFEQFKKK